MTPKGLFLNFEGLDGCGKSTQVTLLAARLRDQGYDVLQTAEPGGTAIGIQIRRVLLDAANAEMSPRTELLLYFAARAQNVDQWIRPALERGAIVLTERFTDSTRAYQGAARRLGGDVVNQLEAIACQECVPDLTLCFEADLETCLDRSRTRGHDRMETETREFYKRVWEEYVRIAEQEPQRFRMLNATGTVEDVAERLDGALKPLLETRNLVRIVNTR